MPATTHYLLDSNVCIAVLRKAPNLKRLPPPERCLVSQITVAELWTGVEKGNLRDERAAKLDELLASFTLLGKARSLFDTSQERVTVRP